MERSTRKRREQQIPWYESNLLWGPVGLVATILAVVFGMVALLWLAWVVTWITVWAITQRIAQPRCEPAYFVLGVIVSGLLLYGIRVGFEAQFPVGPQLSVESDDSPYGFIPQDKQASPPKVIRFKRIKVTNAGGKSISNVKVTVTRLNDKVWHLQLPLWTATIMFEAPRTSPVLESVALNPGEDGYFYALVECNGALGCPSGVLAIPFVENGGLGFFTTKSGVAGKIDGLTVRASGDGIPAVTKTFTISRGSQGELLLR
jgi:hypothetical protein